MAEFCPVLPAGLYKRLDVSYPGAWHFVHAPQVVGCSQSCAEVVETLKRHKGTTIMDCYAFELDGTLPCIQDVYEAATILRDDNLIIVCPDILKNGKESFDLVRKHAPALSGYGRIMVVPHGRIMTEWMGWAEDCIEFCRNMGMAMPYIGLPRYMGEWGLDTRYKAATWLYHYYHAYVHLLGAGRGLNEVMLAARAPSVMSCDSTAPFAYAMEYGVYREMKHSETKVEMNSDWWNLTLSDVDYGVLRVAQQNIALWKEALKRDIYPEPYLCQ